MAIFGRRQPHAPIILRPLMGLAPQGPIAKIVQSTKASQFAAIAARAPRGHVTINRVGPPQSVAEIIQATRAAQTAAVNARAPRGHVTINRVGAQPAVGRIVTPEGMTRALLAALLPRLPRGAVIIKGLIQYQPPAPNAPVGKIVQISLEAVAAALLARRPSFRTIIKTIPPATQTYNVSCFEQANATDSCSASVFPRQLHRLNPDIRARQRTRHFQQRLARTPFVQIEGTACNTTPCVETQERWTGSGAFTTSPMYMNGAGSIPSNGTGAMTGVAATMMGTGSVFASGSTIDNGCCTGIPTTLHGTGVYSGIHAPQTVTLVYVTVGLSPGTSVPAPYWQGVGSGGATFTLFCESPPGNWAMEFYYGPTDTPVWIADSTVCTPIHLIWNTFGHGDVTS
jgi:hypothetical protein